jgi:UDP-N-acetylglucosamine 2-epimerase (non-hydrolysing)
MNITIIAGARPNFMKIAPIIHEIINQKDKGATINFRLVHTGQHFDEKMSHGFFKQLNIPEPDINLNCGGGSQAEQTASIMVAFEKELISNPCDLLIVVGDVTSTMACTIVAKKMNVIVAHVEAGIRSYDLSMPEEINRMVTDSISDYFFTTTNGAGQILQGLGIAKEKIFFVGNVMIDTLLANKDKFKKPIFWDEYNLVSKGYIIVTLHRPANVDNGDNLKELVYQITSNVNGLPVIFPMHPRTAKVYKDLGISATNLYIVDPLGYHEFNYLVEHAKGVITDSGGITEETTVLNIPCITLRNNTERPETVSIGTNELIGTQPSAIKPYIYKMLNDDWKVGTIPEKWDGFAARRIVEVILNNFHFSTNS